MVRVLALLPYATNSVPGQRFRIEQWAPYLEREGISIQLSPFLSRRGMEILYRPGRLARKAIETIRGYARRLAEIRRVGPFDVAYVFREATLLGPPLLERFLARRLPLVLDFDDAIYLEPANAVSSWAAWLRDSSKTDALCRLARHVTVGNEILAQHARSLASAVSVLPTTIDTDSYIRRERPPNARPIVGWSGSLTTLPYLAGMREVLLELRRRAEFEIRVIGGEVSLPGLDVRCVPWRPDTEVEDLRAFDIGLMPLPDDPWTRGKCGLKALQYMGLGIPAVVSPVGVNAEIVSNGVNGFHASAPEEWIQVLERLIRDPALRSRLGAEARRTVEERYSARLHAPRLAGILRDVAQGGCR